ncbi:5971_t:CDS:2 [Paraglomus occultum]|uniref:RBR-type E3 ubiquitin transferase n=1 Tax=Paraglomus occultum TaxID=144539 RepID=A0A9N9FCZ2_9GLOM|nr:5971_t:CDS:2 [Paraglomus occultum]
MQDSQDERDRSISVQLHLNEVHDVLERRKGKGIRKTDAEYALELHQEELRKYNTTIKDAVIAKSIQGAINTDWAIIQRLRQLELQEAADRRLALQLATGEDHVDYFADEYQEPDVDEFYINRPENHLPLGIPSSSSADLPRDIYPSPLSSLSSSPSSPSWLASHSFTPSAGPSTTPHTKSQLKQCNCCFEHRETHSLACMHNFCYPCLRQLFVKATTDETLMPVRCCGEEISIEVAERVLDDAELQAHLMKRLEVISEDKLYCPNPLCSTFIPLDGEADDIALCTACDSQICLDCRNYAHSGNCPEDPESAQIRELAIQEKWQECCRCHRIVDLYYGCNHMTCICRNEFCYECGEPWKSCDCPMWDEERLILTATERVRQAQPYLRGHYLADAVDDYRQRLEVEHACRHQWTRIQLDQAQPCANCWFMLKNYTFECRDCLLRVCFTCRYHRILYEE